MTHKAFYRSEFLYALAYNIITPFLPIYALLLGASNTLIGLQFTLPNIVSTISQMFWSKATSSVRRKRILVIVGGLAWSLFWIPVAFASNPYELIAFLTFQAFFLAMSTPAWTALLIESTPSTRRPEISSRVYFFSGLGAFIGSITSGIILAEFGFMYFIFYMAAFFGIMSKIMLMRLKSPDERPSEPSSKFSIGNLKDFREHKELRNLTISRAFLSFAEALPTALFTIYVIQNLSGSAIDVAIIAGISGLASVISYNAWGKLIEYLGKRAVMLSVLIPISLVPFWYYIAPNPQFIYAFAVLSGISWAGLNLSVFTYLSEVVPKEGMRKHISVFNTTNGLAASGGYILGGVLADIFSISFVFTLAMIIRAVSISLFTKLKERPGFKSKTVVQYEMAGSRLTHSIGNFAATYSLLADEIRRETMSIGRLPVDIYDRIAENVLGSKPLGYIAIPKNLAQRFEHPGGSIFGSYEEMFEKLGKDGKPAGRIFKNLVVVGDMAAYGALGAGLKPYMVVYDGKEGADYVDASIKGAIHSYKGSYHRVTNPHGRINKELWKLVKSSFPVKKRGVKIKVEGCDSMSLVPIILESPNGTKVIYSMPGKGIVLVEVGDDTKNECKDMLKKVEVRMKGKNKKHKRG